MALLHIRTFCFIALKVLVVIDASLFCSALTNLSFNQIDECKTASVKVKGSNMTLSQRSLSQTAINVLAFCFKCKMKYCYAFLSSLFRLKKIICVVYMYNVLALRGEDCMRDH